MWWGKDCLWQAEESAPGVDERKIANEAHLVKLSWAYFHEL
jgi:enoyl reductase-like protein